MDELRGTPLHKAAAVVRSRLNHLWSRMEPALGGMVPGPPGEKEEEEVEEAVWGRGNVHACERENVEWDRGCKSGSGVEKSGVQGCPHSPHSLYCRAQAQV